MIETINANQTSFSEETESVLSASDSSSSSLQTSQPAYNGQYQYQPIYTPTSQYPSDNYFQNDPNAFNNYTSYYGNGGQYYQSQPHNYNNYYYQCENNNQATNYQFSYYQPIGVESLEQTKNFNRDG